MSIHDLRVQNPVRLVVVPASISPADHEACALGGKRCHRMNGHTAGGYACDVFRRRLPHTFNPFRVPRLELCKLGERQSQELAK